MINRSELVFGSSRLQCNLDPVSGTLRIAPAGMPVWECRLFSDIRAALAPEDFKWEIPRKQPFAWAPGKNEIDTITPR